MLNKNLTILFANINRFTTIFFNTIIELLFLEKKPNRLFYKQNINILKTIFDESNEERKSKFPIFFK